MNAAIEAMFMSCNSAEGYVKIEKIGSGRYGDVHKVRRKDQPWQQFFAMKTFKTTFPCGEGIPWTSIREVELLATIKHQNIVELKELVKDETVTSPFRGPKFSIILEFCEHDLEGLLRAPEIVFTLGEKKSMMQQFCKGLQHLHQHNIMHRDLKPSNILLSNSGVLKLADFGMAKRLDGTSNMCRVVTLYFRAPEIILGDLTYDTKVDMWAAGCIMAQLWIREPVFRGESEIEVLDRIAQFCGPINRVSWPNVNNLPYYWLFYPDIAMTKTRKVTEELAPKIEDPLAINLIDNLLVLNPLQRMGVMQALAHPFFSSNPPAAPAELSAKLTRLPKNMLHRGVEKRLNEMESSKEACVQGGSNQGDSNKGECSQATSSKTNQ